MTDILKPLPQAEILVRALLRAHLNPATPAQIGRDILGTPPEPWYLRLQIVGGAADRLEGVVVLDVEAFAPTYLEADSLARTAEGVLLGYPHVVEVDGTNVVIDSVSQNALPHEIYWEDETVSRILATYVITMRR